MTPVVLLVVFCAAMSAIALGRLAIDDKRDPIDIGVALIVTGSLPLSLLWISLEEPVATTSGQLLLAAAGFVLVITGVGVVRQSLRRSAE